MPIRERQTMDLTKSYRPARGFSFRRESFGGILYHYEGVRPDPRVYFVEAPFLVALLEVLLEHPETTLGDLFSAVREQFSLSPQQVDSVEQFFSTLTRRGALVAQ